MAKLGQTGILGYGSRFVTSVYSKYISISLLANMSLLTLTLKCC